MEAYKTQVTTEKTPILSNLAKNQTNDCKKEAPAKFADPPHLVPLGTSWKPPKNISNEHCHTKVVFVSLQAKILYLVQYTRFTSKPSEHHRHESIRHYFNPTQTSIIAYLRAQTGLIFNYNQNKQLLPTSCNSRELGN